MNSIKIYDHIKSGYLESKISKREVEVLKLISHGYNYKEIGNKLYISPHTAASHRKNLIRKFDVSNIAALVRKGFELGLLVA